MDQIARLERRQDQNEYKGNCQPLTNIIHFRVHVVTFLSMCTLSFVVCVCIIFSYLSLLFYLTIGLNRFVPEIKALMDCSIDQKKGKGMIIDIALLNDAQ